MTHVMNDMYTGEYLLQSCHVVNMIIAGEFVIHLKSIHISLTLN